ncbi:MAG: hypothetical protein D6701_15575 [Gemmatimonadetes bacterium]|nr:MAG: hypothetical protein D6701_15575 [Gemmatimonadota bacterium]
MTIILAALSVVLTAGLLYQALRTGRDMGAAGVVATLLGAGLGAWLAYHWFRSGELFPDGLAPEILFPWVVALLASQVWLGRRLDAALRDARAQLRGGAHDAGGPS